MLRDNGQYELVFMFQSVFQCFGWYHFHLIFQHENVNTYSEKYKHTHAHTHTTPYVCNRFRFYCVHSSVCNSLKVIIFLSFLYKLYLWCIYGEMMRHAEQCTREMMENIWLKPQSATKFVKRDHFIRFDVSGR